MVSHNTAPFLEPPYNLITDGSIFKIDCSQRRKGVPLSMWIQTRAHAAEDTCDGRQGKRILLWAGHGAVEISTAHK